MHTQPWVIDNDERITPWEWANRTWAVMQAEAEAREIGRQRDASKARINRVRAGKGKFQGRGR